MSDPDNPEAFVRDFVDKDLGVTFFIHKSGSDGAVYASAPFRHDYLVYVDDKVPRYCTTTSAARDCPGKADTTKCPGHPTRSFIGYLRPEGQNWLAFDQIGRPVMDEFDRQETAAYAIYRAKFESAAGALVNRLLEMDAADDADAADATADPKTYAMSLRRKRDVVQEIVKRYAVRHTWQDPQRLLVTFPKDVRFGIALHNADVSPANSIGVSGGSKNYRMLYLWNEGDLDRLI